MISHPLGERAPGPGGRRDLVVIGGGVMGLFTAYWATRRFSKVVVLEQGRIGDPLTASYGLTRSYRRDYLDSGYARLADETIRLWAEFESATATSALVRCGCMNIASASVTPELDKTYASLSLDILQRLGAPIEEFDRRGLADRYPYLRADLAYLDDDAGLVNLPSVARALESAITAAGGQILPESVVTDIAPEDSHINVRTESATFQAGSVVVTAGHGTNDVLNLIAGCDLRIPITKDRPSEAKYYRPPPDQRHLYTADAMPVIAYLDTGIYMHPIVDGLIDAIKIGYYNPPDLKRYEPGLPDIASFVAECAPGLKDSEVWDVTVVDQCHYDLVDDDEFVLGSVPGIDNVFVGVGWRGTGYKFAPWVGRVLADLSLAEGTVYDISRFRPGRFVK